jgi:hypothetical protein
MYEGVQALIVKINGVAVGDTLADRIVQEVELAKEQLNKASREVKRSKHFKKIIGLVTFLGVIGTSAVAKAETLDNNLAVAAFNPESPTSFFTGPLGYVLEKLLSKIPATIETPQENSAIWQLNNYMTNTLFQTQNFFTDPSIVGIFHTIWGIVLSFTTLMIGKKGYDMVKARVLGAQSQGATEFIIRLIASGLMSFLSLDLIGIGIQLSNLTTSLFMKKMTGGFMYFTNALQLAEAGFGSIFWMVGFVIMFVLLGVRYWSRQINLIVLGCMTPVANMSWVTDGGSMLGTLIKEVVLSLTTPIVQAAILGIGTTILMHVGTAGTVGFINSVLIGLSTMCLMFITPDFLRKFTTGSFNPFKAGMDMFLRMKAMPLQFLKMVK